MKDDFDRLLEKHMQDSEFKAEYEALKPEHDRIQAMIDTRKEDQRNQKTARL